MEAALVSAILKIVGDKLVPLVLKELSSIEGVTKDLQELQALVEETKSCLQAVGYNGIRSGSPYNWLKQLKDISYDVEDLVHEFCLEAEKHDTNVDGDKHNLGKYLHRKPKKVLLQYSTVHEIKNIKTRFAAIVKERNDFNVIANSLLAVPAHNINKTIGESSLLLKVDETKVYGRDDVKCNIICKLINNNRREGIHIVSIVGLGGCGKTYLAKYICQDNKVKEYFDVTFWVHVTQEFNMEKLIGKLFEAVADEKSEVRTLQYMCRTISEILSGRKFLLVLDDVWNEDQHDWYNFEQHFNSGAPGSRILLTTRNRKVAELVKSVEIIDLPFLSERDSWQLFCQCFGSSVEYLDPEFIQTGKDIVKKCGGMPLAIKTLAGALHNKRGIEAWRAIRDSNLLNVQDLQERVCATLMLSYFHLPDHLKQCFTYCAIFPKGYIIKREHLISQWIAQGIVNVTNEVEEKEDIGSYYFDCLLKVSFLQDSIGYIRTGEVTCKMHDLVHDLARQILLDEIIFVPKTGSDHAQRCRYLSLDSCTEEVSSGLFDKLRALCVCGGNFAVNKPIKRGYHVRTVILEDISAASFPLLILNFPYLGYLKISGAEYQTLPEAISHCWNLQALHITNCKRLVKLPDSIGKLRRLRSLEVSHARDIKNLPESIGDCCNLQSLHLICCSNLKEIPTSVGKIKKLRVLNTYGCYSLQQLPSESFGMLQNLQSINLNDCRGLKYLPTPASFVSYRLRVLKLSMVKLTTLPQCITLLTSLEYIELRNCMDLVELPAGIGNLKRLLVLDLEGCCSLRGLPRGIEHLTRIRILGLFVIGDGSAGISELRSLNMICGDLKIVGIRNLKTPNDAHKAYLKKKNGICRLTLDWWHRGKAWKINNEEGFNMEQELAVLDGLQPPSRIKCLTVRNYGGSHFPCWMAKQCGYYLDGTPKVIDTPHFLHLTELILERLPNLKHLRGIVELPLLNTLKLVSMPNLVELWTTTLDFQEDGASSYALQCFPRLSTIGIRDCPILSVKPYFPPWMQCLTLGGGISKCLLSPRSFHLLHGEGSLSCYNNGAIKLPSYSLLNTLELQETTITSFGWEVLQKLTALKTFRIFSCSFIKQSPDDNMRNVSAAQGLNTDGWSTLSTLPDELGELRSLEILCLRSISVTNLPRSIAQLTSLARLTISLCGKLMQLPDEIRHLTALQELHMEDCYSLEWFPEGLGDLHSLRYLKINNLCKLSCLPQSIRHLASLQKLELKHCDNLKWLPEEFGDLSSLRSFHIYGLPALACLPESMQRLTSLQELMLSQCSALTVLPEWMGKLSALQRLWIHECPGLMVLPQSIRHLTALRYLSITSCPELSQRYSEEVGDDWHLISHIPGVNVSRVMT